MFVLPVAVLSMGQCAIFWAMSSWDILFYSLIFTTGLVGPQDLKNNSQAHAPLGDSDAAPS